MRAKARAALTFVHMPEMVAMIKRRKDEMDVNQSTVEELG
jgi:hypothetical protein